jgi:hypothetical protein
LGGDAVAEADMRTLPAEDARTDVGPDAYVLDSTSPIAPIDAGPDVDLAEGSSGRDGTLAADVNGPLTDANADATFADAEEACVPAVLSRLRWGSLWRRDDVDRVYPSRRARVGAARG